MFVVLSCNFGVKSLLNMYVPKDRVSKYEEKTNQNYKEKYMNPLLQLRTSAPPVSEMFRSSRQKSSKDIIELNIINWIIMDIYRTLHPATAEYTFFSSSPIGTFTKIDHIWSHKTHLNKFKRLEIIQCLFSDHSGIKLEISNRKIVGKSQYTWE